MISGAATAGTVWATVALFLSIVPSYAKGFLGTSDLALLAAVAAVALLACGVVALVVSSPAHSLAVLVAGALLAGAGHGTAFLSAQAELNDLAPPARRGEVTAAFIACIYFVVATAVIGSGVLDLGLPLSASVEAVAACLAAGALAGVAWQLRSR